MTEVSDDLGTEGLSDAVVNQRAQIVVYMTATGHREGSLNMSVSLDGSTDPMIPFQPPLASWRGWDGEGLSKHERRYISAMLMALAVRLDLPDVA